ncbi:MAG: sulfatase-like hydrolase/transferase [Sulfurovaceae bacterium]|nr:sulfatase-like hydrolase/transferase [Sulfurovaceae bacterium]
MVCLKYKSRNFVCVKKSILYTLLYAVLLTLTLMLMDKMYALSNEYFIFKFTSKEFFNKLFLFALLLSVIPKYRVRLGIYLLMVSFSFVQYLHFEYFGKNINAIEFYLLGTNLHETIEALSAMLGMVLIPLLISMVAFGFLTLIDRLVATHSFKYKHGLPILLVGLLALNMQMFYLTNLKEGKLKHSQSKLLYPTTNRHSARNFFISANYFFFGILPKKIFGSVADFPLLEKPNLIDKNVKRTIILVIGESLRYDTFSLHDNKLTPKLQTLKDDKNFFYKKVYSGGTMTKVSVSTLINRLKYPGGLTQISQEENCLFKLAKENAFSTYFLSGQTTSHLQIIRDLMCPKYIDKLVDRNDFEAYMKPVGYDEDLQTLMEKLDILKEKNFIVLQHRGSHTPYEKQYPKEYDKYGSYENTALYTDNSLSKLIEYVKEKSNSETFLFYVSDHGELLGKNGKKGHGHLEKEVYEVPFLMYTNSKDEKLRELFKYIKNHYDISNYVLSLLGYEADLIKDEDRTIYILNADLDGFSGYGVIDINNSVESKMEIRRY